MKYLIAIFALMVSFNVMAIPDLGTIMGTSRTEVDGGFDRFRLTDANGDFDDATAFLLFESASNAGDNAFGIYGGGQSLQIFDGSAAAITSATLSWNTATNEVSLLGTLLTAFIDFTDFGFYLDSKDDGRFYSESDLNVGDQDLMAAFDTSGTGYAELFGSNLVLAFEDTLSGDLDYNDLVVGVSDIAPRGGVDDQSVPEPVPLALLGVGMIGLGLKHRRIADKHKA